MASKVLKFRVHTHRKVLFLLLACVAMSACASGDGTGFSLFRRGPPRSSSAASEAQASPSETEVYRRVEAERAEWLALEVERLQADLRQAEEALVAAESGLRGIHTRADAVSSLAEARIDVERAAREAPWRQAAVEEARQKLEEAERQIQAGHLGSAVFFGSRARRIARGLIREAQEVERNGGALFIRANRVNLRGGPSLHHGVLDVLTRLTPVFPERSEGEWVLVRTPSGRVGWVHTTLLRKR